MEAGRALGRRSGPATRDRRRSVFATTPRSPPIPKASAFASSASSGAPYTGAKPPLIAAHRQRGRGGTLDELGVAGVVGLEGAGVTR